MTAAVLEGYAVLPSHEVMLHPSMCLAELGKEETNILTAYNSEDSEIPEKLAGDVSMKFLV